MSNKSQESEKGVVIREYLDGQYGKRLFPVRCSNPQCGKNNKLSKDFGGAKLLGMFPRGTWGEIQCSRCRHLNAFVVE